MYISKNIRDWLVVTLFVFICLRFIDLILPRPSEISQAMINWFDLIICPTVAFVSLYFSQKHETRLHRKNRK